MRRLDDGRSRPLPASEGTRFVRSQEMPVCDRGAIVDSIAGLIVGFLSRSRIASLRLRGSAVDENVVALAPIPGGIK